MARFVRLVTLAFALALLVVPTYAQQGATRARDIGGANSDTAIWSGRGLRQTGEFDFLRLDAWTRDYKTFLDLVCLRLRPRRRFLAHNVVNKPSEMTDFRTAIRTDPRIFSSIVAPSGTGVSSTMKARQIVRRVWL